MIYLIILLLIIIIILSFNDSCLCKDTFYVNPYSLSSLYGITSNIGSGTGYNIPSNIASNYGIGSNIGANYGIGTSSSTSKSTESESETKTSDSKSAANIKNIQSNVPKTVSYRKVNIKIPLPFDYRKGAIQNLQRSLTS